MNHKSANFYQELNKEEDLMKKLLISTMAIGNFFMLNAMEHQNASRTGPKAYTTTQCTAQACIISAGTNEQDQDGTLEMHCGMCQQLVHIKRTEWATRFPMVIITASEGLSILSQEDAIQGK